MQGPRCDGVGEERRDGVMHRRGRGDQRWVAHSLAIVGHGTPVEVGQPATGLLHQQIGGGEVPVAGLAAGCGGVEPAGVEMPSQFFDEIVKPLLRRIGLGPRMSDIGAKTGPVLAIVVTTLAVWIFDLGARGVAIVGEVPQSLPPLTLPSFSPELLSQLFVPALLISIIGFVESISVAQTLAAKKRQRIDPDQELIGLGTANLGAAFTGGFPVTGGFSRSVVNYDAGAETPAAGAFTAAGLALAALFLTPLIHFLPKAALAATIIVAVLSLVDFSILKRAWHFSRADFAAVSTTILLTLVFGVEVGVTAGVVTSIFVHLYKTSRPHMAVVGRVPGTEHFRNVLRHEVETQPHVLTLRMDESLYFPNARYLEDQLSNYAADKPELTDVVLMFPAVNEIDLSALESLEAINTRLHDAGVRLHLSEVKGPVMDRLKRSHFLDELTGEVFLSQHEAACRLAKALQACDESANAP